MVFRDHDGQPDPRDPRGPRRPDRRKVRCANWRRGQRSDIQQEYFTARRLRRPASPTCTIDQVVDPGNWTRRRREPGLRQGRHRDRLGDQAQVVPALPGSLQHGLAPARKISQLDLAYHDIHRGRGVLTCCSARGGRPDHHRRGDRRGGRHPPQTTAPLRGEFIRRAQEAG